MKLIKWLLPILFVLISSIGHTQTNEWYYKAISTEIHVKNTYTGEWDLYQKNAATNITVVVENDFISIQAQKPTIYRIYKTNLQDVSTDKIEGTRYVAKDLKSDEYCTIDVLKSRTSDYYMISVIKSGINLRYLIDEN